MGLRRPQPASHHTAIPTLGALLALGAELTGCHDPACADSRAHELDAHGRLAAREARHARMGRAAHEIALATGLIAHLPAPIVVVTPPHIENPPDLTNVPQPGAALPVTALPPSHPDTLDPRPSRGEAMPVGLRPPDRTHRRR